MSVQATRRCRNCKADVNWIKVRPVGAHRARFSCVVCGGATARIHGRRKKDTMPKGLYGYRQKVKVANDLWRHLIYKRAINGACARCGTQKGLQAMHIFPKGRYPHLRFELDNGAPGCAGCHRRLTNDHELHRNFCLQYLGAEAYERLRLRSISRAKLDIDLTILYLQRKTNESTPVQD
jgi:5-methylcytosine-specific restriction endonuclease McrA